MIDSPTLPVPTASSVPPTQIDALVAIPEQEIWLASQKRTHTRRAYQLAVQHFMQPLGVGSVEQLRQLDHRAVIAWERSQSIKGAD